MEQRKRRWWTRTLSWVSALVVFAGILSAIFQLLIATAPSYRDELAQRVSTVIGQPITVGGMAIRWRWLQPLLELNEVALLNADHSAPIIKVQRLRLGFKTFALLRGELTPSEVNVSGVIIPVRIDLQGKAHIEGLVRNGPSLDLKKALKIIKNFNRLKAQNVAILLRDSRYPTGDFAAVLTQADVRLDGQSGVAATGAGFELRAELAAPGVFAESIQLKAGITGDLEHPEAWGGRFTLIGEGLQSSAVMALRWPALSHVASKGLDVSAKGEWAAEIVKEAQLQLSADELSVITETGVRLQDVNVKMRYRPLVAGGEVHLQRIQITGSQGAWPDSAAKMEWSADDSGKHWHLAADYLRLEDICPWLVTLPEASKNHATITQLKTLKGTVQALDLTLARAPNDADPAWSYQGKARLVGLHGGAANGIHLELADARKTGQGIDGDLDFNQHHGVFQWQGADIKLSLPKLFAQPLPITRVSSELRWQRTPDGWRVTSPEVAVVLPFAKAKAALNLRLRNNELPDLKLEARFNAPEISNLKDYIPIHWGKGLQAWLRQAVIKAKVGEAYLLIDGPLADFPFVVRSTGRWNLHLPILNAQLDYSPEWPIAQIDKANIHFTGNGLGFSVASAQINKNSIAAVNGAISEFSKPVLQLDGKAQGLVENYYAFLRNSPLKKTLSGLVDNTDGNGPANLDVHLEIPLSHELNRHAIASGTIGLQGASLSVTGLANPVEDIQGKVQFSSETGITARDLKAKYMDTVVNADIGKVGGYDQLNAKFNIKLAVDNPVASTYLPVWLLEQMSGASEWQLAMPLSGPQKAELFLSSILVGSEIRLPEPAAKSAADARPITIHGFADANNPLALGIDIPDYFGINLQFLRNAQDKLQPSGMHIKLGGGVPNASKDGLVISGSYPRLNPLPWLSLGTGSEKGLELTSAHVQTQALVLGGAELGEVSLKAQKNNDGLTLNVEGNQIKGALHLPVDKAQLTARLAYVHLPSPSFDDNGSRTSGSKIKKIDLIFDPLKMPTIDGLIQTLTVGKQAFGTVVLRSERLPHGQKVSNFSLTDGILAMNATGEWNKIGGRSEAKLDFKLSSNNISDVLEGLGYAPTMWAKKADISGSLQFNGNSGLDWENSVGNIYLHAENGALKSIDPGGARVLGLLNFYALPRRFSLNFNDVTKKGLAFDRIDGSFFLADGIAKTDNLNIFGPSLSMEIRGKVGLLTRDYDQVVTVKPNLSGLAVGAAIIGGTAIAVPAVGVIALIADQLLQKPLSQVSQFSYHLGGTWENPEIQRLDEKIRNSPEVIPP